MIAICFFALNVLKAILKINIGTDRLLFKRNIAILCLYFLGNNFLLLQTGKCSARE